MSFCKKCGRHLPENAKFCDKCGTRQEAIQSTNVNPQKKYDSYVTQVKRETVYEGNIHKCPNCGVVLDSFKEKCPSCGHEIRDGVASVSVRHFFDCIMNTESEAERIRLIKTYPIPSNKEDILEFMITATSSFDPYYYVSHLNENDISDAWYAKIKQCYEKSKLFFTDLEVISKVEEKYNNINSEIEKAKKDKLTNKKEKQQERVERSAGIAYRKQNNKGPLLVILAIILVIIAIVIGVILINGEGNSDTDTDVIKVGFSSSDAEGQYYQDVKELFEEKGFTNVNVRGDGWNLFKKSGTVKRITIDGKDYFYSSSKFNKNSQIIIFYYE